MRFKVSASIEPRWARRKKENPAHLFDDIAVFWIVLPVQECLLEDKPTHRVHNEYNRPQANRLIACEIIKLQLKEQGFCKIVDARNSTGPGHREERVITKRRIFLPSQDEVPGVAKPLARINLGHDSCTMKDGCYLLAHE